MLITMFSFQVVKELTKELFLEVITEMCNELSVVFVKECHMVAAARDLLRSIADESVKEMTKDLVSETIDELRREKKEAELRQKAILAAERQASINQASDTLVDDIVQSTVGSLFDEIAQEEYRYIAKTFHFQL